MPNLTPINLDAIPEGAVYITKRQAALETGMSVSWFNKLMAEGRIRAFKVSTRKVLFLRADVINLIAKTELAG